MAAANAPWLILLADHLAEEDNELLLPDTALCVQEAVPAVMLCEVASTSESKMLMYPYCVFRKIPSNSKKQVMT